MLAIRYFFSMEAVSLLVEYKANTNVRNNEGWTALMYSVMYGQPHAKKDIISLLLDNGANINARDNKGNTALMISHIYDNKDMTTFLKNKGADIHVKDYEGKTYLEKKVHLKSSNFYDFFFS
jgi:ankyrin repeat protein